MVKIILRGCNGKMGRNITEIVNHDEEVVIVAGIDIVDNKENEYPVFTSISSCYVEADVIIDFASSVNIEELLEYAKKTKLPIVLCTTGLSEEQQAEVERTSKEVAILKSANMSLGINTIIKLLKEVSKTFADEGFDIEIVEKHHNQKVDSPSGTALALADAINNSLNNDYTYNYDRSKDRKTRDKKEIGISAVRGGTIIGEHEIIFAGLDEVIEIKHTAYSKALFGKGAVTAAKFLAGKSPGMYDMSSVVKS